MKDEKQIVFMVIYPLTKRGGAFKRITLWGQFFPKNNKTFYLFTNKNKYLKDDDSSKIKIEKSLFLSSLMRKALAPSLLYLALNIFKYEPKIIMTDFLWPGITVTICKKLKIGKDWKHLVYLAGDPVPQGTGKIKRIIYEVAAKNTLHGCDVVICISKTEKYLYGEKYKVNKNKIGIVPIGTKLEVNQEVKKLHTSEFVFGVVARLAKIKCIDKIILAFEKVLKHDSKKKLLSLEIFGDGEEQRNLKKLVIEKKLENQVKFRKWETEENKIFCRIDCLLLFSKTEGTPRVIIEAGKYAIPTISKNVGGVPDMIKNEVDGILVDSEEELIDAMTKVVNNENYFRRLKYECKRRVYRERNIENEVSKLTKIIEEQTN